MALVCNTHAGFKYGSQSTGEFHVYRQVKSGEPFLERTAFTQIVVGGMSDSGAKNKFSRLTKAHPAFLPTQDVDDCEKYDHWVFKMRNGAGPCLTVLSVEAAEHIANGIWKLPKDGISGKVMAEISSWKDDRHRMPPIGGASSSAGPSEANSQCSSEVNSRCSSPVSGLVVFCCCVW